MTVLDKVTESPVSFALDISLTALLLSLSPAKLLIKLIVEENIVFKPIPTAPSMTAINFPLTRLSKICIACTPPNKDVALNTLLYEVVLFNLSLYYYINSLKTMLYHSRKTEMLSKYPFLPFFLSTPYHFLF